MTGPTLSVWDVSSVVDYVRHDSFFDTTRSGLMRYDGNRQKAWDGVQYYESAVASWERREKAWRETRCVLTRPNGLDMPYAPERLEIPYCHSLLRLLCSVEENMPAVSDDEADLLSWSLLFTPYDDLPFVRGGRVWCDCIRTETRHRVDERSPYFVG